MAMVTQTSPHRDPLVDKLKPEHVTKVLQMGEEIEKHNYELKRQEQNQQIQIARMLIGLAALVVVVVFFLCWLFFAYGKSEQVSNIITMLIVGSGGVGIGTGIKRLTTRADRSGQDSLD